jgi:signal transduction histidine kinase
MAPHDQSPGEPLPRFAARANRVHELKNLLTVMVGCVESIGRTMPAGTTVAVDLVELRQAIDGAVDLVNELLVVGHARPVEPPLFIDISRLVVQMDATLSRILGPKIDLRMRLTTMGGIVRAAPVELEGILLNLVARARDAMPDGGVVTIETSSFELGGDADEPREEPRRYVRLSVSDSGLGIAANERTTILDSLFTTEEKDTGLGLHGVNLVVQRLNGLLRVESQEGVGTQVHVCLPLALQESGF